jgi:hypothetical protein
LDQKKEFFNKCSFSFLSATGKFLLSVLADQLHKLKKDFRYRESMDIFTSISIPVPVLKMVTMETKIENVEHNKEIIKKNCANPTKKILPLPGIEPGPAG